MAKDKEFFSGERAYRGVAHKNIPRDHLDRYNFAANLVNKDSVVVDAACGSGYGSEILSSRYKKVFGFDLSDHALRFARNHHQHENICFLKADLNALIPMEPDAADFVVSFETLEHVARQDVMLKEFSRILKKGGTLIISTPDREVINGPGNKTTNPFHIHEISKKEFITELRKSFIVKDLYGQDKFFIRPKISQKVFGFIGKIDVFGLRHYLSASRAVHAPLEKLGLVGGYTPLEKISPNIPSGHAYIVAVCGKK